MNLGVACGYFPWFLLLLAENRWSKNVPDAGHSTPITSRRELSPAEVPLILSEGSIPGYPNCLRASHPTQA
jgi:hypothetical protein